MKKGNCVMCPKVWLIGFFMVWSLGLVDVAWSQSISNRTMEVRWNGDGLSLRRVDHETPFFMRGQLSHEDPVVGCRVETEKDPVWGEGRALRMEHSSGDTTRVVLYDDLPFVLFRRTLVGQSSGVRVVNKDPMASGEVALGASIDSLKTMGTAGLHGVDDHPGSYTFLVIGEPVSRRGVVCAWLTHDRGSGVVFSDQVDGQPRLAARVDYGDLRISSNTEATGETLVLGYFDDVREGLERYADALVRQLDVHLPEQPVVYCTWYHAGASDEERLKKNALFARDHLVPYGFHVMQIDDRWQDGVSRNGPRKDFSHARPDGPYPSGMKGAAEAIRRQGLVPGIWFMPFAGTWNDPYWADKQDLFYKEGRSPDNYIAKTNDDRRPDFPPGEAPYVARWGGTCLDMTNPKSREYLYGIVHRIAHDWGFGYFKMDGLWTGTGTRLQYVNSAYQDDDLGMTKRFDPSMTPIEAYRCGLDVVRKAAGPDVFFLGCCAPQNMRSFGPALGKVQAMRVGPDNGARPQGLVRGPLFATRVFFLNKRVWYNDPDPVYVRPSFPTEMAHTSVSWTALTGSLHSSSYSYYDLPPERLSILQRSLPAQPLKTVRPVDYLESDPASIWHLIDDRDPARKDVVGMFNWDVEQPKRVECTLDRLELPDAGEYVGFDFWADRFLFSVNDVLAAELPPGGCRIVALRPARDYPQVVSTSRHVTQGVVDLRDEAWDEDTNVLSGTSQVVGGDLYEIRVVAPTGPARWAVDKVTFGGESGDEQAEFAQEGAEVRIRIRTTSGGTVRWKAHFRREPGERD